MACKAQLRELQGRLVGMALAGGGRIDECHLISSPASCGRVWAFENGRDIFIPVDEIRDCWEVVPARAA
jgi:hypothetical protein